MSMVTPLQDKATVLKVKTAKLDGFTASFKVKWLQDHHDWKDKIKATSSVIDERVMADPDHGVARGEVSGDKAEVDWKVVWEIDDSNLKEIYAVIRAEYRFVKDNGWSKLAAKKGRAGIDNLFRKGNGDKAVYAICESKCTEKHDKYLGCLEGNSPLSMLGRPYGRTLDDGQISEDGIRQMSAPWRTHAYAQELRGNPDPEVRQNLVGMKRWECEKHRAPLLWLNVYAPPDGKFYLLPGRYTVNVRVGARKKEKASSGDIIADWSDERYRPLEFFALDSRTARTPHLSGDFHDFSVQFRNLTKRDEVFEEAVADCDVAINRELL